VQMAYTGRMFSWGLSFSSSYRRRSLSMAAPSTQSVPLHLTATVSPRWAQAIRATSPKAPLPRWRRKARSAHGTRGRQPLAMDGDVVAGGTPAGVQGGDVTAGVPWYMQACQGGSGTRWLRCGCRFTETCAKTCPQGNLERPGPAQLWFEYQAKAAQLLGKLDLGFPGFSSQTEKTSGHAAQTGTKRTATVHGGSSQRRGFESNNGWAKHVAPFAIHSEARHNLSSSVLHHRYVQRESTSGTVLRQHV
jgi:hypothetical protein